MGQTLSADQYLNATIKQTNGRSEYWDDRNVSSIFEKRDGSFHLGKGFSPKKTLINDNIENMENQSPYSPKPKNNAERFRRNHTPKFSENRASLKFQKVERNSKRSYYPSRRNEEYMFQNQSALTESVCEMQKQILSILEKRDEVSQRHEEEINRFHSQIEHLERKFNYLEIEKYKSEDVLFSKIEKLEQALEVALRSLSEKDTRIREMNEEIVSLAKINADLKSHLRRERTLRFEKIETIEHFKRRIYEQEKYIADQNINMYVLKKYKSMSENLQIKISNLELEITRLLEEKKRIENSDRQQILIQQLENEYLVKQLEISHNQLFQYQNEVNQLQDELEMKESILNSTLDSYLVLLKQVASEYGYEE